MKNRNNIILLLAFILMPVIISASSIFGDIDNDGKVSSVDYILVKKHILNISKLTGDKLKRADVNGDNKINSLDYIKIKKIIIDQNSITKKRIKVGTFNIASYDCGTGAGGARCETNNTALAKTISDNNVDIIGIQEGTNKKFKNKNDGIDELSSMLNYNYRYVAPYQLNATLTHFTFKNISKVESEIELKSCGEKRAIIKSIVNINGVDISIYTTHYSWESGCPEIHFKHTANILKNDPNPIIIFGDFNNESINNYDKYFKPIGLELAAYDDNYHSEGKTSYLDSIWIKSNDHIDIIKSETIHTHNIISDHNLITATLDIY